MCLGNGIEIFIASIDIDNDPAWNLQDPATVAALFRLAKHGFIDGITPLCGTHSKLRFNLLGNPGEPRPLRLRGKYAWGRPGLNKWEPDIVKSVNALIFSTLALCEEVVSQWGAFH